MFQKGRKVIQKIARGFKRISSRLKDVLGVVQEVSRQFKGLYDTLKGFNPVRIVPEYFIIGQETQNTSASVSKRYLDLLLPDQALNVVKGNAISHQENLHPSSPFGMLIFSGAGVNVSVESRWRSGWGGVERGRVDRGEDKRSESVSLHVISVIVCEGINKTIKPTVRITFPQLSSPSQWPSTFPPLIHSTFYPFCYPRGFRAPPFPELLLLSQPLLSPFFRPSSPFTPRTIGDGSLCPRQRVAGRGSPPVCFS